MSIIAVIIAFAVGLVVSAFVSRAVLNKGGKGLEASEAEAKQIADAARAEAEAVRKDAEVKARELAFKVKSEAEEEIRKRTLELAKKEEDLNLQEEEIQRKQKAHQKKEEEVQRREKGLTKKEAETERAGVDAEKALADARGRLEQIAGLSQNEARQKLTDQIVGEARLAAAVEIKKVEEAAAEEANEKAKMIVSTAIQRYAGEYVGERTVTVVPIPSDDMKGRLIGREGRNVRALEAATGVDLIIDDTPEVITISCFNPVRRQIAQVAITKLLGDGRIHPTRIEEVVEKATKEIDGVCKEAGEQAVFDLGLHRVHPELVRLLGSLKFRSSYAQNLLAHSIEVGFLAGAMAAELQLNVKQARRAGLLHDIGKAVDHEQEGSHSDVGARLLKKYGESPKICQAAACHHGEVEAASVLDHLVDAANKLSGQRPGARRETLESYVQRLYDMEKLAESQEGVKKAYAIQAGRELRVLVENSTVTDEGAILLSKDLAKRIETEMAYPGQVRVCVLRETRASDYAR